MSEANYNKDSCGMIAQTDDDAVVDGPPGSFAIVECKHRDGEAVYLRMFLRLPNGAMSAICINGGPSNEPQWQWNGDRDKPTLTPSVHQIGGWHGWVRNGRMVSA